MYTISPFIGVQRGIRSTPNLREEGSDHVPVMEQIDSNPNIQKGEYITTGRTKVPYKEVRWIQI